MKTVEELKKEAQEEITAEAEVGIKGRIKSILYNIGETQRSITAAKKRLVKYQEQLATFKVED